MTLTDDHLQRTNTDKRGSGMMTRRMRRVEAEVRAAEERARGESEWMASGCYRVLLTVDHFTLVVERLGGEVLGALGGGSVFGAVAEERGGRLEMREATSEIEVERYATPRRRRYNHPFLDRRQNVPGLKWKPEQLQSNKEGDKGKIGCALRRVRVLLRCARVCKAWYAMLVRGRVVVRGEALQTAMEIVQVQSGAADVRGRAQRLPSVMVLTEQLQAAKELLSDSWVLHENGEFGWGHFLDSRFECPVERMQLSLAWGGVDGRMKVQDAAAFVLHWNGHAAVLREREAEYLKLGMQHGRESFCYGWDEGTLEDGLQRFESSVRLAFSRYDLILRAFAGIVFVVVFALAGLEERPRADQIELVRNVEWALREVQERCSRCPVYWKWARVLLDVVYAQAYHMHEMWGGFVERVKRGCLVTAVGARKHSTQYEMQVEQVREGMKAWRHATKMCEHVHKQRAQMLDESSRFPLQHPYGSVSAKTAMWRRESLCWHTELLDDYKYDFMRDIGSEQTTTVQSAILRRFPKVVLDLEESVGSAQWLEGVLLDVSVSAWRAAMRVRLPVVRERVRGVDPAKVEAAWESVMGDLTGQ